MDQEPSAMMKITVAAVNTRNDGKTARIFFENHEIVSSITRLDQTLVSHFHVMLEAILSDFPVDVKKFDVFAKETANLYVHLYGNFMPISPTMHKILAHGAIVFPNFMVPIGQ
ncbi:hypothetical protein DMENIID0001_168440 [Sergentomyia squamirostris]